MVVAVRRITRPLADLRRAAERFGRGETPAELAERGPLDVRETVRAFNLMSARLQRYVQDRTLALAAISHDLRTPLTALRVRAEMIRRPETRTRMLATLDEMQDMVEATLQFAREEAEQEPPRAVDLSALVASVCEDLADTGADVRCEVPQRLIHRCSLTGVRRVLRNVVENAVRYGGSARVTLGDGATAVTIRVDDDGPGIDEADRERVFTPFFRAETSRSLDTGGVGLGLAIARSIVRRHGGDVRLGRTRENAARPGLSVSITLPKN